MYQLLGSSLQTGWYSIPHALYLQYQPYHLRQRLPLHPHLLLFQDNQSQFPARQKSSHLFRHYSFQSYLHLHHLHVHRPNLPMM